MGEGLLDPPRYALACGEGVLGRRQFHNSVQLHCKCKVTVKSLKGTPPTWFSNKRCSCLRKPLTFDENACFTSPPRGCRARAAEFPLAQIRCTGPAYADIRTTSAAQVPHLLTFASMSLQIRCTDTAYAHFRFKSAAPTSHMLTFASKSLQIRRASIAYAYICSKPALASH